MTGLATGFAVQAGLARRCRALLAVLVWWAVAVKGVVQPEVVVAAAALVVAHLAALLASYGPVTLPVDPATLRLWARRGALVLLPAPVAWAVAELLRGEPEQPGIWILGVLGVLVLTVAASVWRAGLRGGVAVSLDAEEYVERVLQCVEAVPRGRVTTYGAIAEVVGAAMGGGGPRLVGVGAGGARRPGAVVAGGPRGRDAAPEPPGRGPPGLPRGGHPAAAVGQRRHGRGLLRRPAGQE